MLSVFHGGGCRTVPGNEVVPDPSRTDLTTLMPEVAPPAKLR